MKSNTKKYSKEELKSIFLDHYGREEYVSYFFKTYNKEYEFLSGDEYDLQEGETLAGEAMKWALEYLTIFNKQLEMGHSAQWADLFAECIEEGINKVGDAYWTIRESDPTKAKDELIIYCKATNRDSLFTGYFIYLMNQAEGIQSSVKRANIYSEEYPKQIAAGKSTIFAHEYSAQMSMEYVESSCYAYAYAYDKAMQLGKSDQYCFKYAEMLSDFIGDQGYELSDLENDSYAIMKHDVIIAKMQAWEYANENKIEDSDLFISEYEFVYQSKYHSKTEVQNTIEKDVVPKILVKALEYYNKRRDKQ